VGQKKKKNKKKIDSSVDKVETEKSSEDVQPVESVETASTDEVFMEKPVMELYSRKEKGFYAVEERKQVVFLKIEGWNFG